VSRRDDDRVVVALDPTDAELLLARLGWELRENEAIDPHDSARRYRLTSPHQLALAVRRAVRDLAGAKPNNNPKVTG
jgi:hypothetical protein